MDYILIQLIFAAIVSFVVTLYLIPLLIRVAHKLGAIDAPDGKLKIHKEPTPYLGGLAVYLGFISCLALMFPFENNFFLFLLGITLLLFVGLIDDLIVLKPQQKFLGQLLATFCFLKGGFYLKEDFLAAGTFQGSSIFWMGISAFWILSIINAFNLIDVMDGLATTAAMTATVAFLCIATLFDLPSVALLCAAFLGALLGFFIFNKPPAKMYLGDAGSLCIGGFLAVAPFLIPWGRYTRFGFFAPVIILLIPILELCTLILIRAYKKIPFYRGSPDHFSIYLGKAGWGKKDILAYVASLGIFLGGIAIQFSFGYISLLHTFFLLMLILVIWFVILIHAALKQRF